MKHKKLIVTAALGVLVIATILVGITLRIETLNVDFAESAEVTFKYIDDASYTILDQELSLIKSIFNGKKMYKDNPSCGFSEDVSIKLDGSHTFCIAQDTCPIIYWKEDNKFFRLREEEKTQLYNLLQKYGFYFPCV